MFMFMFIMFLCALFVVLRYLCLYVVLFLLLIMWLLTQHINKLGMNYHYYYHHHYHHHHHHNRHFITAQHIDEIYYRSSVLKELDMTSHTKDQQQNKILSLVVVIIN